MILVDDMTFTRCHDEKELSENEKERLYIWLEALDSDVEAFLMNFIYCLFKGAMFFL